ncbi:unnamed protein product [Trichogramma brassicae]|uniref:Uncharacterized protein n=1 Tax=Trichogramma brassicae TaxID=86971 RepID=A0A6H5IWS5_9HYME|nr:unnamed protein product [Trichogramma brassicae]
MRRLGVQGLIFFQLGEPPILYDAIVDCRIPFFRAVCCVVTHCWHLLLSGAIGIKGALLIDRTSVVHGSCTMEDFLGRWTLTKLEALYRKTPEPLESLNTFAFAYEYDDQHRRKFYSIKVDEFCRKYETWRLRHMYELIFNRTCINLDVEYDKTKYQVSTTNIGAIILELLYDYLQSHDVLKNFLTKALILDSSNDFKFSQHIMVRLYHQDVEYIFADTDGRPLQWFMRGFRDFLHTVAADPEHPLFVLLGSIVKTLKTKNLDEEEYENRLCKYELNFVKLRVYDCL